MRLPNSRIESSTRADAVRVSTRWLLSVSTERVRSVVRASALCTPACDELIMSRYADDRPFIMSIDAFSWSLRSCLAPSICTTALSRCLWMSSTSLFAFT